MAVIKIINVPLLILIFGSFVLNGCSGLATAIYEDSPFGEIDMARQKAKAPKIYVNGEGGKRTTAKEPQKTYVLKKPITVLSPLYIEQPPDGQLPYFFTFSGFADADNNGKADIKELITTSRFYVNDYIHFIFSLLKFSKDGKPFAIVKEIDGQQQNIESAFYEFSVYSRTGVKKALESGTQQLGARISCSLSAKEIWNDTGYGKSRAVLKIEYADGEERIDMIDFEVVEKK